MSNNQPVDKERRIWMIACGTAGGVAAGATGVTLLSTMAPSERAKAAGAPVEVDISDIPPGTMKTVEWRGKPVWIVHRTPEEIAALPKHDNELADPESKRHIGVQTPPYCMNEGRSIKPEYFIAVGICTHLGCSPSARFVKGPQPGLPEDWPGGWLCPCHGSTFDLAGRVFKNKPAPDNLVVPPHEYLSETKIMIGVDKDHKA